MKNEKIIASCTGTTTGYVVEVRSTTIPRVIGKQIVTKEWSKLVSQEVPDGFGVPCMNYPRIAGELGLFEYSGAMAMAALVDAMFGIASCLEFRIVKQRLEHSYTLHPDGVGEPFDFFTQRRNAAFTPESEP